MLRRGGAGGSNLNLANGLTQPEAPKPNTLWLKTAVTLGRVAIQSTQPTAIGGQAPAVGDVWVRTAARGTVAVTQAGIAYVVQVASVYTAGGWAYATGRYWNGSVWATLGLHLLLGADACASITGGWNTYYTPGYSSLALTANGLEYSNGAGTFNWGAQTAAAIDLSAYGYLRFIGLHTSFANSAAYPTRVGAGGTQMSTANSFTNLYAAQALITNTGAFDVTLDVAALFGGHKVGIGGVAAGRLSEVIAF